MRIKISVVAFLLVWAAFAPWASAAVFEPDEWARGEIRQGEVTGILPKGAYDLSFKAAITREEFCEIIVRVYERAAGTPIPLEGKNPFTDTDNSYVLKAASLKMVNGYGDGTFLPTGLLTRQEAAKMICNAMFEEDKNEDRHVRSWYEMIPYRDRNDIAEWAVEAVYTLQDKDIMKGNEFDEISPRGNLTRQEAMVIAVRVLNTDDLVLAAAPVTTTTTVADEQKSVYEALGAADRSADSAGEASVPATNGGSSVNIAIGTKNTGDKVSDAGQVTDRPAAVSVSRGGSVNRADYSALRTRADSEAEARAQMKTVTINVWHLDRNGKKVAATDTVTVHQLLADDVWHIFQEIFESPEQFPLKVVCGFDWRGGSRTEHNLGTAIDLNPDENAFIAPDGRILAGSFYSPYENPYSIPPDGSVVKAFQKYGWSRGAWANGNDYMHFSLFGT